MSYDLAVWEGPRPESDEAASEAHVRIMEQLESDRFEPASPAIQAYVDALLARWPDITEEDSENSPWAGGPLIGDASGSVIHFSIVWDWAEEASEFAAVVAAEHGLVCFDPQQDRLRPPTAGTTRGSGLFARIFKRR